jgi:hypothetical protein
MSIIDLPVQVGTPEVGFSTNFQYTVFLEGVQFGLIFYTEKPDDQWFFDITDVNFERVVAGLGLAVGLDLLFPYRSLGAAIPPGILYCVDLTGNGADPTVAAFENETHVVRYMTSDQAFPDA